MTTDELRRYSEAVIAGIEMEMPQGCRSRHLPASATATRTTGAPAPTDAFPARIAVQAGDFLGNNDTNASDAPNACWFTVGGADDEANWLEGDLADGASRRLCRATTSVRQRHHAVVDLTRTGTASAVDRTNARRTPAPRELSPVPRSDLQG